MNTNFSGLGNLINELKSTDSNGLSTAGSMYRSLLREIARSGRYSNPFSMVRLKCTEVTDQTNSGNGQDRQQIRNIISDKLANNVRIIDYVGTWEDDEYLIFLPETNLRQAEIFAHKIKVILEEGQPINIQMGVAQWEQQDDASSLLEKTKIKTG